MSTDVLLETIREKLDALDSSGEQAVALSEKILQIVEATPSPPRPSEEKFVGHNITLEEYEALPLEKKSRYHDEAEELNWRWVERQLNRLGAKWVMVVDGQVIMHGATLENFPGREELLKIYERTGKYPFAFFSPRIFAIEELSTSWHTTLLIRYNLN